jgi:thioredoxin-related protein
MPRTHFATMAIMVFASLGVGADNAVAQDVQWRHDYVAARKEALETGRPLLLDFGTESCFWCKKLDITTFRDPKIVKLLSEKFIPVKIDAEKEERLTQALGIVSFPTLVLATPDGKVVGRHPGYADVTQLTALLNKAPAQSVAPVQPVAPVVVTEAEKARMAKEQLDADLAALHLKIAATLGR